MSLVYKYPLETRNVDFDLKIGESDSVSENQNKNIDAMLWWLIKHKQEIFKNNQLASFFTILLSKSFSLFILDLHLIFFHGVVYSV